MESAGHRTESLDSRPHAQRVLALDLGTRLSVVQDWRAYEAPSVYRELRRKRLHPSETDVLPHTFTRREGAKVVN
eukprot:scaffold149031_cov35-Tisochrysis_lutea.AAC.1